MTVYGYANGTIATIHKILYPSFEMAIENDIIFKNPSAGCLKDYPRDLDSKYALTTQQEQEFLARFELDRTANWYKPAYEVMLYAVLRIGELIGLR